MTKAVDLRPDANPCLQDIVVVVSGITELVQLLAALLVWLNDLEVQTARRKCWCCRIYYDAQRL